MTLEELQILITANTAGLQRELDGVKKQLDGTTREVQRATGAIGAAARKLGATLAAIGIGAVFKSAKKDAIGFEAAVQQINRLMGTSAGAFQQWADTQASGFGLARSEAVRYGAVFANLISGFSAGTAQTAQRTRELLQTAAIVSSATGRTMEDTLERIRSGLLGNTEAIEDLGINVNVALIQSTDAFKRFANGRSWQQLDFQTQQTILYFGILEQAAKKYGTELAQNTSRRQAAFVAQLNNSKLSLGQAFLPIYNTILPALTRFATALANIMSFIAAFSQALFGSGKAQQQTNTITSQADAVGGLGDAYEQAGKQAKGAVAGFDQVNLIGGNTGTGAEGGVGGVTAADSAETKGAFSGISESMDEVAAKAREMADKVKSAFGEMRDFIVENEEPIIAALAGISAGIAALLIANNFSSIIGAFKLLATAIGALLSPIGLVVIAIAALVGAFVYFYRTNEQFRSTVQDILQQIGDKVIWLWNEVFVPFGQWLGSVMVATWNAVGIGATWLWQNVLQPFGDWLGKVMPIAWDAVATAASWLWQNILVPFGDFLLWLWDKVLVPIGGVLLDVLAIAFDGVAKVAKSFWEDVLVPLGKALAEMFGPAVEAVSAVLTFLWENVLQPFGKFIQTDILPIIEDLINVFVWLLKNGVEPLAIFVKDVLVSVFTNAFKSIGDIIGGVKDIFIGLMTFITGVFTGDWQKAWDGVRDIFKGVFESLWGIVKFPLNLIIDGINTLLGGLNKISFDFPDWVPVFGGKTFGISIPAIPKLAVGTNYVAGDGLAYLHEGEAVVPKRYNPAAGGGDNREVVSVLRQLLKAIQAGQNVHVSISQEAIGRASTNYINAEVRSGRNPLSAY